MFQRGIDVKEALGLGEYAPMVKGLREFFEQQFVKGKTMTWSSGHSSSKATEITGQVMVKNIPDAGGGNVNRFAVWIERKNLTAEQIKQMVKDSHWSISRKFQEFDCQIFATNFYVSDKHKKRYDFPLDKSGLVTEFNYTKNK